MTPESPGMAWMNAATTLRRPGTTVSRRSTRRTRSERSTAQAPAPGTMRDATTRKSNTFQPLRQKRPAVTEQLHREFGEKDQQAEFVERDKPATGHSHDRGVCFKSQDDGIREDHPDDPPLDHRGFHPAGQADPCRGDSGLLQQSQQVLLTHRRIR